MDKVDLKKSHRENYFFCIFFQSSYQVDMKNVIQCPREFFAYFNALETRGDGLCTLIAYSIGYEHYEPVVNHVQLQLIVAYFLSDFCINFLLVLSLFTSNTTGSNSWLDNANIMIGFCSI